MKALVDYIHYSDEMCGKLEFGNVMFESLEPYPEEVFIRQMEIQLPGFSKYVSEPPFGSYFGHVMAGEGVLDLASIDELEKLASKFSYRLAKNAMPKGLLFKPDHARADIPVSDKFIHLSPVDDLDRNGIRCKASGRFEQYSPRVYLIPLGTLVDHHLPPEEMYYKIMESCIPVASRFNDLYLEKGFISERESYFVYLVTLPETYPLYNDMSSHDGSVYVLNEIPGKFVSKIGTLEKP